MKFTLKDYQEEAVVDVLSNLRKAAKRWHSDGDKHAFSLTATTGAGKTVMAAAAFEALFHGDDAFDFEADPGAVVIWFSDDPSLNEQTRFRLLEAADKLAHTDLKVVENTFSQEKFEAGKIYFLNTQKLGKKSLLVRGHEESEEAKKQLHLSHELRPDLRSHTIWDTIQNTIEDPELTLYLVLDEAHRGMGKVKKSVQEDKSTIVKRLINGSGAVPAIPVVWGISATVERFNAAISIAEGRSTLPNVVVDSSKVQDSGLLKDTIILDIPDEVGKFDTVLVKRATDKIKAITAAWNEYGETQEGMDKVVPLMVLQSPNTPSADDIGKALDTIFQNWPELSADAVAHVFGDHKTQQFGGHTVFYISPEHVQDNKDIRVLIAKDAISTGWDCPRAEVMVSFRPAKDKTHITQLLGRMVRTPLARRIPGNDRLNSVDCLLPLFDTKTVGEVADVLMKGGVDEGETTLTGRRILINPVEVIPNPSIEDRVWDKFVSLPSQSLPQKTAKPVKRLTALAQEFSLDGLIERAGKKAHAEMHKVLEAAQARYADEIKAARTAVLTVEGKSLKADLKSEKKSFDDFLEDADYEVIEDAYRRAARVISPDLARTFADYLAEKNNGEVDMEEALIDAHTDIAALGLVSEVQEYLDGEADRLAKKWLEEYRVAIKALPDERQEAYRVLRAWSNEPQDLDLVKPTKWMVATTALENGQETPLDTYSNHLMCIEENEQFPEDLKTSWEKHVLATESARSGYIAWYRNPARASQESLGVSYHENDKYSIVRPDFVFFAEGNDEEIAVDIVDPHGHHLSDALPKLKGLAQYAETHADHYRRIEAVAEVDGVYKVLDLTEKGVRDKILESEAAKEVYVSSLANNY
tara:strand:+ start:9777 stop:12377 length:2601 start_codon:yes stop_codon:yes gene_type:complete